MKRILLLVLLIGFTNLVRAQKFEIYGAYGLGSAQEIIDGLSDMGTSLITGGNASSTTSHGFGPIIVGANYYLTARLTAGVLYSNTSSKSTVSAGSTAGSDYKNTYNVFMARTDYRYVNKTIQLYSGISLGASIAKTKPENGNSTNTASSTDFAYQVNALGIRAGKNIGAFAELGFGYNGIINVGISAKF
ncbi:hypothetical protein G7074_23020 [Pedobacter sp. HDW13]|uniref:hypothetical protein n=1 Tax=unclassified Pedobacter TaxID=2628915 RepID=UPI000F5A86EE|nr:MULTISPECIES: hypothetical protein [unclassified Pedobacter]QIL41884.1 hypothetical protein G7074_23020 [Pedobacter sp. HDW13]RQO68435.1 hypothetical protein DBR40_19515 [Pedobacter sp. KBW01]